MNHVVIIGFMGRENESWKQLSKDLGITIC